MDWRRVADRDELPEGRVKTVTDIKARKMTRRGATSVFGMVGHSNLRLSGNGTGRHTAIPARVK